MFSEFCFPFFVGNTKWNANSDWMLLIDTCWSKVYNMEAFLRNSSKKDGEFENRRNMYRNNYISLQNCPKFSPDIWKSKSFYQFIAHFCVCHIVSFRNGIFKGIKNEKKLIQKVKKFLKHITQKTFSSHSTDKNTWADRHSASLSRRNVFIRNQYMYLSSTGTH